MKAILLLCVALVITGCSQAPAGTTVGAPLADKRMTALSNLKIEVDNRSKWTVSTMPHIAFGYGANFMLHPKISSKNAKPNSITKMGWTPFANLPRMREGEPTAVYFDLVAEDEGSGKFCERYLVFQFPILTLEEASDLSVAIQADNEGATCHAFGMTARTPWTVRQGFPGK